MNQMRHHRLRVTLHWLLAALVAANLAIGFLWLRPMANADPRKIAILALHMAGGLLIVVVLLVRLGSWLAAPAGPRPGRIAAIVHRGLYALIVLIVASGIATALLAGLPRLVIRGAGTLPARFTVFPTFLAHAVLGELLTAMILLHIASALFHHLVLKDGLLSLVSFGGPSRPAASTD